MYNNIRGTFTPSGISFAHEGGQWLDYDRDGLPDYLSNSIIMSGVNPQISMYLNRGYHFQEQVIQISLFENCSAVQCVWGDFDNDRSLDIAIMVHMWSEPMISQIDTFILVYDVNLGTIVGEHFIQSGLTQGMLTLQY